MRFRYRFLASLSAILMAAFLTAGLFAPADVLLDTDKHVLYKNVTADVIMADVSLNESKKADYRNGYFAVYGLVTEKKSNGRVLYLGAASLSGTQQRNTIECSTGDKQIIAEMAAVSVGDIVKVYGKITFSLIGGKTELKVDHITGSGSRGDADYEFADGTGFSLGAMPTRTLHGKTFYIPESWAKYEHNIAEEELGYVEGYQYRLNELSGTGGDPESLFICYFDYMELADPSRKGEVQEVEKLIVSNILGKDISSVQGPSKKKTTYYGKEYHYYQGIFEGQEALRVEFVFQPDLSDKDGMIFYLYAYQYDCDNLQDVLMTMRMLGGS